MNRFEFSQFQLLDEEKTLCREIAVRIYDGNQKTSYENGELLLTNLRVFWGKPGDMQRGAICLVLQLKLIVLVEEESSFGFSRSKKVVLHLSEPVEGQNAGPSTYSQFNHIKFSFREGINNSFTLRINDAMQLREWETIVQTAPAFSNSNKNANVKLRTGIVGIERNLQEKQKAADDSISVAFQDLSKLMEMAKDMVSLSQKISTKIRDTQGDITTDETVLFKTYLMSLGIDDPVTRESSKSALDYHKNLAAQMSDILLEPIKSAGGMMTLTDVFCMVNRARGLEQLLSPEDLLNACKMLDNSPLKLHKFQSGVKVLQLRALDEEAIAESTLESVSASNSMSVEELAQKLGISILLAKERLQLAENLGKVCRDESFRGLRFYPNRFMLETA